MNNIIIKFKDYTLSAEQLSLFAEEYFGRVAVEIGGKTKGEVEFTFDNAKFLGEFKSMLDSTFRVSPKKV